MPIRFFLIFVAFLLSVLMWVDRACISAAKDNIASDLNLTDGQMAWVMGAFSLGYAFFQVPGGNLADRLGPRRVMTMVCVAWSVMTAATGLARGAVGMVGIRFLFGAGEAGGYPTLARAFTSWLPVGERGIANSVSFSGGRLGAALAMPGVVWLMQVLGGWRPTFFFFGAIGTVFAVGWFFLFRDLPEEHPWVDEQERDHILANRGIASEDQGSDDDAGPSLRTVDLLGSRNLRLLMYQYVAHNFTFFFTVSWFFPYLKSTYELTATQTGWMSATPLLCGVVGNWIAGSLVDGLYRRGRWKWSRQLPASVGFLLGAIGMASCIHMQSPWAAVACMSVAIFGADMVLSPSWSTCMDIGGKDAGMVSGSMNMIGNLGAFSATLAFPYLYAWVGSHHLFFYLAALLNLFAVGAWCLIRPDLPMVEEVGRVATETSGPGTGESSDA